MDFGRMFSWPTHGCRVGKGVERGIDEFAVRLRIFELFQFFHPLVVFDAFHFHLGHLLVLHLVELFAQDDVRDLREWIPRASAGRARNPAAAGPSAESCRADTATAPGPSRNPPATRCSREVSSAARDALLRVLAESAARPLLGIDELHDLPVQQRAEQLPGALDVRLFLPRRFVAVAR